MGSHLQTQEQTSVSHKALQLCVDLISSTLARSGKLPFAPCCPCPLARAAGPIPFHFARNGRPAYSGDNVSTRAIDDGQDSPSLHRLLTNGMLDDACRVRLWVEQRRDGGFWEAERDHRRLKMPIGLTHGRPPPRVTQRETFGGVRLACMSELPPWDMKQTIEWGTAGGATSSPGDADEGPRDLPVQAEFEDDAQPAVGHGDVDTVGAAERAADTIRKDLDSPASATSCRERRILVFLKTLGFGDDNERGQETAVVKPKDAGDCNTASSDSVAAPKYLTHAILRQRSPLRTLFELAADRLGKGTRPEELGAYLEDLPCAWQDDHIGESSALSAPTAPARCARTNSRPHQSRLAAPAVSVSGTSSNHTGCRHTSALHSARESPSSPANGGKKYRRFFPCPPPVEKPRSTPAPPSAIKTAWTKSLHVVSASTSILPVWSQAPVSIALATNLSAATAAAPKRPTGTLAPDGGSPAVNSRTNYSMQHQSASQRHQNQHQYQQQHHRRKHQHEAAALGPTLEEAGISSGASICFFRKNCSTGLAGSGEAAVARVYQGLTEGLVEDMRKLLEGEGPLGRVHHVKVGERLQMLSRDK